MQQFGSANNFSGQIGERALKSMVKDHAQQTQRRVNVFASQCADREYESNVYTHAYNDIKHLLGGAETTNAANVDRISPLYRGQHLVTFATGNVFGGDSVSVQWKDKTRNKVGIAISNTSKYAVKTFACSQTYYDSFQVTAYTSARLLLEKYLTPVLFYANNYLYGGERYHFCMVQFADTLQGIDTFSTCPAQIVGLFKYESRGIPTPDLIDKKISLQDIKDQNMIDDTMYAVVHTATSYVSWEELERSFVIQFTLGNPKDCVYVVSVENITDTLFVFHDYGNDGSNYFCTLPYKRWGAYFRYRLSN